MKSVCIIDFCGRDTLLEEYPVNFSAEYFIEEKRVVFYGHYGDIPDMLSNHEPSEEEVNLWIEKHENKCDYLKRRKKAKIEKDNFNKRMEILDNLYNKKGCNKIFIKLKNGDIYSTNCGIHNRSYMENLIKNHPNDLFKDSEIIEFIENIKEEDLVEYNKLKNI